jgi:hypothetical protein
VPGADIKIRISLTCRGDALDYNPLLDAEEARLRALECTTANDFLIVVAIKRQLGTLKRYLKISTDDVRRYQTMRVRAFRARQKAKTKRIRRTRRRV